MPITTDAASHNERRACTMRLMANDSEALVSAGYDAVYQAIPGSPALWQIWLDHAVGRDFPSDFSHISFATVADLQTLADELRLDDGDTLVDLACGMAGPSLWMASNLPIRVVGIDASPVAVKSAAARAVRLGFDTRSSFQVGTFGETGLAAGEADGLLTLDAFQYAPDKAAACREFARILKPGKRLVFMAFEVIADRVAGLPALGDDPVSNYAPLVEDSGFDIDTYEETSGWSERVTAAFQAIIDNAATLEVEMGAAAYGALSLEASLTLGARPYCRRVRMIATRR
jgi:SAM-dependent methyltransferase